MVEAFLAAYDAVLARWPVPLEVLDLPSEYGTTRIYASGPPDGPPLVLLHGGGATATVWFSTVGALSREHRVYAVDQIGAPGRSVHSGRPVRGLAGVMNWLDATLDGLGAGAVALAGHSYGGWLALSYALHAPARVSRLILLDPTDSLVSMGVAYRLRAIPYLLRRTGSRLRGLIRWETRGAPLDAGWLDAYARGAESFRSTGFVMPRRPDKDALRRLTTPTLVLVAERSRSHDPARLAANARRLLPNVTVRMLPGASHHTVPTEHADAITDAMLEFLAGGRPRAE